jgi:hypothetical protein
VLGQLEVFVEHLAREVLAREQLGQQDHVGAGERRLAEQLARAADVFIDALAHRHLNDR